MLTTLLAEPAIDRRELGAMYRTRLSGRRLLPALLVGQPRLRALLLRLRGRQPLQLFEIGALLGKHREVRAADELQVMGIARELVGIAAHHDVGEPGVVPAAVVTPQPVRDIFPAALDARPQARALGGETLEFRERLSVPRLGLAQCTRGLGQRTCGRLQRTVRLRTILFRLGDALVEFADARAQVAEAFPRSIEFARCQCRRGRKHGRQRGRDQRPHRASAPAPLQRALPWPATAACAARMVS